MKKLGILLLFISSLAFSQSEKKIDCITKTSSIIFSSPKNALKDYGLPLSNKYTFIKKSNDIVGVKWGKEFLLATQKQCIKLDFRETLESETSKLKKLASIDVNTEKYKYVFREMFFKIANKSIIPELGILEVKFSEPREGNILIGTEIQIKSVCGYTASYRVSNGKVALKGARIKN